MRIFWIILGLLAVVGVIVAFSPRRGTAPATPTAATPAIAPQATNPQPNAPDAIAAPGRGDPEPLTTANRTAPASELPAAVPQPSPAVAEKIDQIAQANEPPQPSVQPPEAPADAVVADAADPGPAASPSESVPADPAESVRTAEAASDPAPADSAPEAAAPVAAQAAGGNEFEVKPSTLVARDDGALLADDRFVIKGKGTAAEPYEVTWEMLTSAEESYDPRIAKKQIPQRIAMLDGKKVRITGYVAFPMYVTQPRELLAMLNQWDGCCIGVPPTPYDAIEVRLAKAVGDEARMATYGSVEGTFAIKPYVVGDWLIGLYMMENAELKPTQFGGFGS